MSTPNTPARRRVVVLTGAGVSAESGIPTFRDANGLWKNHRIEEVASPLAYGNTPDLVHEFYDLRRRGVLSARPNGPLPGRPASGL